MQFLHEFKNNYMIEHFDKSKFIEKKNRCLRYFDRKTYDKYTNILCADYVKDYDVFQNKKNENMTMFINYNTIITLFMILIYILL